VSQPALSILCPSRQRPRRCRAAVQSALELATGNCEVILGLDLDDPTLADYSTVRELSPCVRLLVGSERRRAIAQFNACGAVAQAPYLVAWSDDIVARTPAWDRLLIDAHACLFPDGLGVLCPADGHSKLTAAPFVSRALLDWNGGPQTFYADRFWHMYGETWLLSICDKVGRLARVPRVVCEHLHHSFVGTGMDAVTLRNEAKATEDAQLWRKTADERRALAGRLLAEIEARARRTTA